MADDASPSSANAPEPQAAGEESKETAKPKERGSTGLLPFKVLLTQDQVKAKPRHTIPDPDTGDGTAAAAAAATRHVSR
jgi:hypothetical protein